MKMRGRQPQGAKKTGRILLGFFAFLFSLILISSAGAQSAALTFADKVEYTDYEKSPIEEDLRTLGTDVLDVTQYPKDPEGKHRLMDNIGFMEYAYSTSAILIPYYGIYFYVYNPTEKEVSERTRANAVNMATEYDAQGEPTKYENIEIQLLQKTANNRFLKFGIVNRRGVYDRAREYAEAHNGARRYDIAGIQLWFKGDQNATDGNTERDETSYTYLCTGYCAGCSPDGREESTLRLQRKELETIGLDVRHTYYRTASVDVNRKNTMTSVYFSVPDKVIEKYGRLQIVDAEWYEYKTSWIFVSDNNEVIENLSPYRGRVLPQDESGNYYDSSVPYEIYNYLGPSDSGQQGIGYNYKKARPQLPRFDWLLQVDDITKEVNPALLSDYANSYEGNASDARIEYGGKSLNANLFADTVDEGRTRGYNHKRFDARNPEDWIDLTIENTTSQWQQFLNVFKIIGGGTAQEDYFIEHDIRPIQEVTPEMFAGNDADVSKKLFVAESRLKELSEYCADERLLDRTTYLLRIGVTEYESIPMECHPKSGDIFGTNYKDMYIARDTAYLDFDILYLGFVRANVETIIPVVSSPIDIYPTLTPPEQLSGYWELVYWLCGIGGGVILIGVVVAIVKVKTGGIL